MAQTLWEEGREEAQIFGHDLIKQGFEYTNQGNYPDALQKFKLALTIFEQLGIEKYRAFALQEIGATYKSLKNFQKALEYQQRALEIYEKAGDSVIEKALVLGDIGVTYGHLKDYQKALEYYHQALKLHREIGNNRFVNSTLIALGRTHLDMKNYKKALEYFYESLELSKDLSDIEGQGDSLAWIGSVYSHKREHVKAIKYFKEALEKQKTINDKEGEAEAYFQLGSEKYVLKNYKEAKEYLTKFVKMSKSFGLKKPKKIALAYSILAIYYSHIGNHSEAIGHLQESLRINNESNEIKEVINDLVDIGVQYAYMENYSKALEYYQQALKIAKEKGYRDKEKGLLHMYNRLSMFLSLYSADFQDPLESQWTVINAAKKEGNKKGEADGYWQLGKIYSFMGDYEKSLKYYRQALIVGERSFKQRDMLAIYEQIGHVYSHQLNYESALKNYQQALDISKSLDNRSKLDILNEREIYLWIGLRHSNIGNRSEAINYMEEAIRITDEGELSLTTLYDKVGYIYKNFGDYSQALDYQQKALGLAREFNDRATEVEILREIAFTYSEKKDYQSAIKYVQEALEIAEKMNFQRRVDSFLSELGYLFEIAGDIKKAKSYFIMAVKVIESSRSKLELEEDRSSFFKNKLWVYERLIMLLLKLGNEEKAFDYLEKAKSRALIDLLGNRVRLQKGSNRENSEEERKLQIKIELLQDQIQREQKKTNAIDRAILKTQIKELKNARKEYAEFLLKIKRENPELSSLISVSTLTLEKAQKLLDSDTTLLEYFVTSEKTILWVVDKSALKVIGIDIESEKLALKVDAYREKIANLQPDYKKEAEELYDLLIRPAKPYIKTKRIGIVPHSVLHYLPFQALLNKDKFLIEEYDIFYTPSASILKFVYEKRKNVKGKVLAFGNPELGDERLNLPYAEEEVKKIKETYPKAALYLKDKATEEKAKRLSGNYNIIHFASHGELNSEAPLFSSIRLAKDKDEDGRLNVHEIFNMNLENTSLVTLSACETGLGKLSSGDELIGMTRGFIYAGTPSIVASLWRVNDQSTSELMGLFYKNLKTHSKAEALRMAQIEMIRGEVGKGIVRGVGGITTSKTGSTKPVAPLTVDGSHPYFWAPFILLGDWK